MIIKNNLPLFLKLINVVCAGHCAWHLLCTVNRLFVYQELFKNLNGEKHEMHNVLILKISNYSPHAMLLNFRRTCGDMETSLKTMPRSLDTPGKAFWRQTPTKKPIIKTNTRQTQVESRKKFSFLFKLLFTYMI